MPGPDADEYFTTRRGAVGCIKLLGILSGSILDTVNMTAYNPHPSRAEESKEMTELHIKFKDAEGAKRP